MEREGKKRGPYKHYVEHDIPASTKWNRKRRRGASEKLRSDHDTSSSGSGSGNDAGSVELNSENDSEISPVQDNVTDEELETRDNIEAEFESPGTDSTISADPLESEDECRSNLSSISSNSMTSEESENYFYAENLNCVELSESSEYEMEVDPVYKARQMISDCVNLTQEESSLLMATYVLRNRISDIGLGGLVNMIDVHLGRKLHGSKYLFLKTLDSGNLSVRYYFCPKCDVKLEINLHREVACPDCDVVYKKKWLDKHNCFFLYLSLENQLRTLVNSECFLRKRQECDETDVISGTLYRRLLREGVIGSNDISVQWNTDGVSLFNTSQKSVWPIQVAVNELPYSIRKNNILLCGLWFHAKKPPMNLYLEPFILELKKLSTLGFDSTTIFDSQLKTIKVHCILCSADSIARPMIQNMKQFNGIYGCSFCLNPGKKLTPTGNIRVYCGQMGKVRTHKQHLKYVTETVKQERCIKGVKGASVVMYLSSFSVPEDCPPDYMHAVLEGVVKSLFNLWFNSVNHAEDWYISRHMKNIDDILQSITPPIEIKRIIRSLEHRHCYTAAEWKYFLFYYSIPCLKGKLPKKYFDHYFLLIWAIHKLSKRIVTNEDISRAGAALKLFVEHFEPLYGTKNMKYNVHLLLHLAASVQRFGAPWAWSNFMFETFNGVLKKLFFGTQYIPEQIVKMYSRLNYVKQQQMVFENEDCNEEAKNLFYTFLKNINYTYDLVHEDDMNTFGKSEHDLLPIELIVLSEYLDFEPERYSIYKRFQYKNVIYHNNAYLRLTKRNNSIVKLSNNAYVTITGLIVIPNHEPIVMGRKYNISCEHVYKYRNLDTRGLCVIATEMDTVLCFHPSDIESKCVRIFHSFDEDKRKYFIFPLVNQLEKD